MKQKKIANIMSTILAGAVLALGVLGFAGCGESGGANTEDTHAGDDAHDHESAGMSGDSHSTETSHQSETVDVDGDIHGSDDTHAAEDDHVAEIELGAAEAAEIGIEIATAGPGTIARTITLPGEIKLNGNRVVHIVPRIGGIVRDVRGGLGDRVKKGQVLAVIESRELADATAGYLASRERLELAHEIHERERDLREQQISSEQEYLDAKQALSEERIAHRAAEQKLLALGLSLKALRGMPAEVEADLTRYEIRSPMNGEVIRKEISLGMALEANTEVFLVADLDTVWVDVSVYQKDLEHVREGQAVAIYHNSGEEPIAEGTIDYLGPVLEHETRTALARIILPNPGAGLRPGTFIKARIETGSDPSPVAVPRDALQTVNGETVLFVPTVHGFEARHVTAGRSTAALVEIVSGLEPGQSYVSTGAFELKSILVTGALDSHAGHGH